MTMNNKSGRAIILVFSLLLSLTVTALAKDSVPGWFFFKGGMERQGAFENTSVELPFTIAWKYKIEEKSNGFVDWGPVVIGDKLFTPDGLNNVLALNANDGTLLWKKQLISNVFTVTLSEDGKILYVTTAITTKASPTLFAIDPETGEVIWDNMVNGQPAVGGMEGAPAVRDGKIYAGYLQYEGNGGVIAYDAKDGKMLWHWKVPRFSPYSPVSFFEGKLYVAFENKTLVCLDASNGNMLWNSQQLAELAYSAPLIAEGRVYIGAGSNIYAFDPARGTVLWTKTIDGQIGHASLSYHDGRLYGATRESKVFALQSREGAMVWMQELNLGTIESSPMIDVKKKMLYIATQENKVAAIEIETGKLAGQMQLSEDPRGVWKSVPAFHNGRMYIGSLDRTFYALE